VADGSVHCDAPVTVCNSALNENNNSRASYACWLQLRFDCYSTLNDRQSNGRRTLVVNTALLSPTGLPSSKVDTYYESAAHFKAL